MRVVFLGTPEFALPTLKLLLERTEVAAVITQPDRPAGRGQRLTSPPVKSEAQKAGVPVWQPERIRGNSEIEQAVKETRPDVMVVVAFGQILPSRFFEIPPHGTINVHASLLPKYRGAAPVAHAVLNGEPSSGVTIMKIDAGMDTGDILASTEVMLGDNMTTGELEAELAQKGAELLIRTLPGYLEGRIVPRPQNHGQATYAPRLAREDARLQWDQPARSLHNRIRALNPRPGAVAEFRSQDLKIWRSQVAGAEDSSSGRPGEVVAIDSQGFLVRCAGSELLRVEEIQQPNRSRISAREFANGVQLQRGERFS